MSVFKCKMCGGTIEFEQGATVGLCDSCGTKQTLPKLDDDRKANLYDRANHFRRNNEFDKAMGIYESILNEDKTDAEAYWSLVLCRYGIEYVEDPSSHKRVPTVNRAQFTSVLADEDYKSAIEYSDTLQKSIYEEEAKAIDEIQKGILEISQKEEPFDVFICYKETDANGRRTVDSVRATELYHELTKEGFKVFFARITLEDKLGTAYEPYIFAALNSAKVMVVLGTKQEYFNAVWVKNEWSRYLSLIKSGAKKTLIPAYQDMDPYDLPEEFSHLQAQDMTKLGFMQDLIRGIKKITAVDEPKAVVKETVVVENNSSATSSIAPLLKRVFMFLEDGKWAEADEYCEKVLDINPECAEAYLGKLMAELHVNAKDNLKNVSAPFDGKDNCIKASRFDASIAEKLKADNEFIKDRNDTARKQGIYNDAQTLMRKAHSANEFISAANLFLSIKGFKDADEKKRLCLDRAEDARKDAIYDLAISEMKKHKISDYESAISNFERIIDWKDSRNKINECNKEIEKIRIAEEKAEAERKQREEAAEENKAKVLKATVIIIPIIVAIVVFLGILNSFIIPSGYYKKALANVESGNYNGAYLLFEKCANYKDTQEQVKLAKVKQATALLDANKYDEAYKILEEIGDTEKINENIYNRALEYEKANDKVSAYLLFAQIPGYKDSDNEMLRLAPDYYKDSLKNAKVGDIIKFGNYYQSNSKDNEQIEWKVLEIKDGKALIISDKALDCKQYNTEYTSVTWETCTLRKWMNNEFYASAFNEAEQGMIVTTKVTADPNPSYSTNPGNDTTDKVFLLSIDEANKYFSSDEDRKCVPTAYAISNGAYTNDSYTKNGEATCYWWLRSPGHAIHYSDDAAVVGCDGGICSDGRPVYLSRGCVRPALWIEIY